MLPGGRQALVAVLLMVAVLLAVVLNHFNNQAAVFGINSDAGAPCATSKARTVEAAADGCYHVYVDLGSNTGVQIHKLFNATLFPTAKIAPAFNTYFGSPRDRADVCAFGFEPNKNHTKYLDVAEKYYRARGRRVTYFHAAAGLEDGYGIFETDNSFKNFEWGGRVKAQNVGDAAAAEQQLAEMANVVPIINIPRWLQENVVARRIPDVPDAKLKPAVVMKIDIEGTDELVLAGIFSRGYLCAFDFIYVEHLRSPVQEFLQRSLEAAKCSTLIRILDDEEGRMFVLNEMNGA